MALYHGERLTRVDPDLVKLVKLLGLEMDVLVVCGYRGKTDQMQAFKDRKSKLIWPKSDHNKDPSLAVDLIPLDEHGAAAWSDFKLICAMRAKLQKLAGKSNIQLKPEITWDMGHVSIVKGKK